MLDERHLATYATGVAAALRVIGPTARTEVFGMMRSLDLADDEAAAAVSYALANGILVAEDDTLGVGPSDH